MRGVAYGERGEDDLAIVDLEKVVELSTDPELTREAEELLKMTPLPEEEIPPLMMEPAATAGRIAFAS